MFNLNFADDGTQTGDLWCQKRPLFQLSHNHNFVSSYEMLRSTVRRALVIFLLFR